MKILPLSLTLFIFCVPNILSASTPSPQSKAPQALHSIEEDKQQIPRETSRFIGSHQKPSLPGYTFFYTVDAQSKICTITLCKMPTFKSMGLVRLSAVPHFSIFEGAPHNCKELLEQEIIRFSNTPAHTVACDPASENEDDSDSDDLLTQ